jgi:GMP synthase-like glutamine amidotransferase
MIPAQVDTSSNVQVKVYVLIKDDSEQQQQQNKLLLKTSTTTKQLNFIHGKYYEKIDSSSIFAAARIFLKKFYNAKEVVNYASDIYLHWVKQFHASVMSRDESGNYKFFIEIPVANLPAPVANNTKLQLINLPDLNLQYAELHQEINEFHIDIENASFNREKNNYAMFDCEPDPMWVNYYDALYYGWLRNKGENWKTYKIYNNEFPSDEEINNLKGILISGSDWNVYNTAIPEISTFLQKLRKLVHGHPTIKIVGICFGSQALAQALGGRCEKMTLDASKGPMIMVREKLNLMNKFTEKFGKKMADLAELYIAQIHGDHVSQAPDGAVIYGKSDNTPVEIWGLNDNILAFQGHPEFNTSFMTEKVLPEVREQYKGNESMEKVIDDSHKSFQSGNLDQKLIFELIDNFLKN